MYAELCISVAEFQNFKIFNETVRFEFKKKSEVLYYKYDEAASRCC